MSPLLDQEIQNQVRDIFTRQLTESVQVLFFGQEEDCQYCQDTEALLQELADLSDKIELDVYDLKANAELARQFNVDKTPGFVIAARNDDQIEDYGIRYAGVPAGHEFSSLIQDLILVSGRDSKLSPRARDFLTKLTKPILLQVFVTPT
jgi:glutaredoxin-like protein